MKFTIILFALFFNNSFSYAKEFIGNLKTWPTRTVGEYNLTAGTTTLLKKITSVKTFQDPKVTNYQHVVVALNHVAIASGISYPYTLYEVFYVSDKADLNVCLSSRTGLLIQPDKPIPSNNEALQKTIFESAGLLLADNCWNTAGRERQSYHSNSVRLLKNGVAPATYSIERLDTLLDAYASARVMPNDSIELAGFKNFYALDQVNNLAGARVSKFDDSANSIGRVTIEALAANPFKYQDQVVSVVVAMGDMESAAEVLVGEAYDYKPDYVRTRAMVERFSAKDWNKNTRWLMAVKVMGKHDDKSNARYAGLTRLQWVAGFACEKHDCSDWKPSKIVP